ALDDDHDADAEQAERQQLREDVRQDVPGEDPPVAGTGQPGGRGETPRAPRQRGAAPDPARPPGADSRQRAKQALLARPPPRHAPGYPPGTAPARGTASRRSSPGGGCASAEPPTGPGVMPFMLPIPTPMKGRERLTTRAFCPP